MFGMKEQKQKTKTTPHVYELEKELRSPKFRQEIVERCDRHTHRLKTELRKGVDKSIYDTLSFLLQGYIALKKVITKTVQS